MNKSILIIGGSPAGRQAALDLADAGLDVCLTEAEAYLVDGGGRSPDDPTRILEVCKHPRIRVCTRTRVASAADRAEALRVVLKTEPRFVDTGRCTACGDCLAVCPVDVPGTGRKAIYLEPGGQPACAVIDKVGRAPCTQACPGGVPVQGYVALIAQRRYAEALALIEEAIPFPAICGRICTHPCELNCRRGEVDAPVAIRLLKRFVTERQGASAAPEPPPPSEDAQCVAVVGAGPAGMTVAERLARKGYRVTVFEKLPVMGGMLSVGIPAYRLPREVIAQEFGRIQHMGVEIRLGTTIGPDGDYALEDLHSMGYAAVCLTVGAHRSLNLGIAGEDLPGVVQGIEMLKCVSLSQQSQDTSRRDSLAVLLPKGRRTRAAVLGGGNTAMDVARTLRRLGLESVRVVYRRSRKEMPALPEEVRDAEEEGVAFSFLTAPKRICGDQASGVTGLACMRMELAEPDASGRRRPVPVDGSETVLDVDLVVLAIGQAPDVHCLGERHGIAITSEQRIGVESGSFATNRPGVFAAGDAVTRDRMSAIEAIGMGKQAAEAIDAYLQGRGSETAAPSAEIAVARRELLPEEMTAKPPQAVACVPVPKRLESFAEVELGFDEEQAVAEARRCLACGPCSECLACQQVCTAGAIRHDAHPSEEVLEIGAVICAANCPPAAFETGQPGGGIWHVAPDDTLAASAAAAQVLAARIPAQRQARAPTAAVNTETALRIGVFVCRCGGAISQTVDTAALTRHAAAWPGVVTAREVSFACGPEGREEILGICRREGVNRAALAACACCALDQVCYGCTYQRVRCKRQLGLFADGDSAGAGLEPGCFEFVNIREQCAWVHCGDPRAATAKAREMLGAALAKLRLSRLDRPSASAALHSVLFLGGGRAGSHCSSALERMGFGVQAMPEAPQQIHRFNGMFRAQRGRDTCEGACAVLVPADRSEHNAILRALGHPVDGSASGWNGDGVGQLRPGILCCDPNAEPEAAGLAAAGRAAGWLQRCSGFCGLGVARVDPHLCRACETCTQVCGCGAALMVGESPDRHAWVDPLLCVGCGLCAAQCPSGAITAGDPDERQLEAVLDAVLG